MKTTKQAFLSLTKAYVTDYHGVTMHTVVYDGKRFPDATIDFTTVDELVEKSKAFAQEQSEVYGHGFSLYIRMPQGVRNPPKFNDKTKMLFVNCGPEPK
jgi:hypothetical protein